jgi:plasmid maintenance system antidote protein VapI
VESLLVSDRITFDVLRARLILRVKLRVNNGEFTERGLARLLGISQSQIHNVLKGARRLQMHLADRILMKLGISAMDLLNEGELDAALKQKMADWDRELAALAGNDLADAELALEELASLKRPAARGETRVGEEARKTG